MEYYEPLFIRHAQSEANADTVSRLDDGDPAITALGVVQARMLGNFLAQHEIDVIVCSPKLRAAQTTEIANFGIDIPVVPDARLAEVDWGEASGQPVASAFTPEVDARAAAEGYDFRLAPSAENMQEAHDRVDAAITSFDGTAVAFVGHSWVFRNYFGIQRQQSRAQMRRNKIAIRK